MPSKKRYDHNDIAHHWHNATLDKVPEVCITCASRRTGLHGYRECFVAWDNSSDEEYYNTGNNYCCFLNFKLAPTLTDRWCLTVCWLLNASPSCAVTLFIVLLWLSESLVKMDDRYSYLSSRYDVVSSHIPSNTWIRRLIPSRIGDIFSTSEAFKLWRSSSRRCFLFSNSSFTLSKTWSNTCPLKDLELSRHRLNRPNMNFQYGTSNASCK